MEESKGMGKASPEFEGSGSEKMLKERWDRRL